MSISHKSSRTTRPWALTYILKVRPQCPACGEPIPDRGWSTLNSILICPTCHQEHESDLAKVDNDITPASIVDTPEGWQTRVMHHAMLVHEDAMRPHRLTIPTGYAFCPKYDYQWGKTSLDVFERDMGVIY